MNGYGYIGQAGTGKTTQLLNKVEESIDFESWPFPASLLAITFMHGSRRRLEDKLKPIQHRGVRVCCQTIDSFCLNVFQRYRSYLGIISSIVVTDNPDEVSELDGKLYIGVHRIRERANELMDFKIVRDILSFSYPIVIVDEFQDCDGALLDVIKKLSDCSRLYVAADNFQKLDDSDNCPATEWLSQAMTLDHLHHIWRTNETSILDSARALRLNEATTNGIEVNFVPSKDIAAYVILSNMQWYDKMGGQGRTVAIISPVGPQSDSFVRDTLKRLHEPMERKSTKRKKGYRLEPKPFQIDDGKSTTAQDILTQCIDWESLKVVTLDIFESWKSVGHPAFEIAVKRAKRLMKLRNTNELSKVEFSALLSAGMHFVKNFVTYSVKSRLFLTVHGAKNREFDDVIILWPQYTLPSQDIYLRKLMYNAITRAKRKVLVIAQGQKERHSEHPLNLLT
jgi:hypothetical protein